MSQNGLAIQESEETLAKKILEEQVFMGWPGLAMEATIICERICLPNINFNKLTKNDVKDAIFWHHYQSLKEEMTPLKKLQKVVKEDLTKPQSFMKLNLSQARMGMRMKTGMLDIAGDMPARYVGREGCRACAPINRGEEGPEIRETMEHMKECEGYAHLWGDEYGEKELINYLIKAMRERAESRKNV